MITVIQRVSEASVTVEGERISQIGKGLLILFGVARGDTEEDARWLAGKIAGLRIFGDEDEKLNRSIQDVGGEVLVVSQFTLLGDCRKGRRPDFTRSATGKEAEWLYERFCGFLVGEGIPVHRGRFGAIMKVGLINDGPVTIIADTDWKDRDQIGD